VPGCDQTYQNWCHNFCYLCTFPQDTVECHVDCDDRYCPTPPSCREEMSASCEAECDWSADFGVCFDRCLNANCGVE